MHKKLYVCDTDKNVPCSKTACHIYGGPCELTAKEEYAKELTPVNKLEEIMDKQRDLQMRLGTNFWHMTDEERAAFMRNHRGYMEDELAEALYEMPNYKLWKDYSDMSEHERGVAWEKVRMELIDALHFFVNLLLCAGMTPEDVYNMYMAKNRENHRRQDAGYTSGISYRDQSVEEVLFDEQD